LFNFNPQVLRLQSDTIYEKLAKPGNDYSVYSNKHYQGKILLQKYRIEQIFQDKSSGFYALGLEATSQKNFPVLLIRGCGNWGTFKDFPKEFLPYQDIPDVIMAKSDEHFQAAKETGVIKWLQNQAFTGIKADIVGQSLGGKVGQQLVIEAPKYIHSLVTFNSIGISSEEFERYKEKVEIFHYINPGDLVPYILGEKFLPGRIFQIYNPTIPKADLLSQHNQLVLDHPETQIKEVQSEVFLRKKSCYQLVENYSNIIQINLEELKQSATQNDKEKNLNSLSPQITQKVDYSQQVIQQKFIEMAQAIRQDLLKDSEDIDSQQFFQKQVEDFFEVIQKEMKTLRKTVQQESGNFDNILNNLRQTLQQKLKDLVEALQQSVDNFWE